MLDAYATRSVLSKRVANPENETRGKVPFSEMSGPRDWSTQGLVRCLGPDSHKDWTNKRGQVKSRLPRLENR